MEAAKPVIKVAAICGSLRKGSFNRGLIRYAMELTKEPIKGMQIEYIDISPLPMLNTDLEVDGKYPPVVEAFRQKILEADAFLFASPEYNYSVSGPIKNAVDWASRPPNVWADKAAAIISASGSLGGARGQYHLRQIGVYLDLHFINKPEFFLNAYQYPPKFDTDGNLVDPAAKERLKEVLLALKEFTLRLQGCNFHLSRMSESSGKSGMGTEEGTALVAHAKENLGPNFNAYADYKLGRTREYFDWHDLEKCNNGRRVSKQLEDWNWRLKNKRNDANGMERMYRMALVFSWVLFVIVLMLLLWVDNNENVNYKRKVYYRSPILGLL